MQKNPEDFCPAQKVWRTLRIHVTPCGFSWHLEGKFLERDVLTGLCNYFSGQRKLALQPGAWENIKGPLVDKTHSYNRTCPPNLLKTVFGLGPDLPFIAPTHRHITDMPRPSSDPLVKAVPRAHQNFLQGTRCHMLGTEHGSLSFCQEGCNQKEGSTPQGF